MSLEKKFKNAKEEYLEQIDSINKAYQKKLKRSKLEYLFTLVVLIVVVLMIVGYLVFFLE